MKQIYLTIAAVLLLIISISGLAQETRIVKVDGWDPSVGDDPALYENLLYYAIVQDSTERKTNPNVIFELKRNQIYFLGKQIENYDFHLHIRGEEGEGLLPEIQGSVKADGTYGLDYIHSYNDLTLENLAVNGYLPDGSYQHWVIECRGNCSTIRYKNCTWDGDRAAAVCARADSLKIYISDCTVGNIGYRTAFGGNGRFIDLRPEALYLDTLVIENSTVYNTTDRIMRNMNTHVNYLYFDHITAVNTVGRHGGVQLGDCKNATIKNSIFSNIIMIGHCSSLTSEQTQPENPPHFSVISLDTIYADGNYIIENNNIYWDDAVKGIWDQIDSVEAPVAVNPLLKTAVDVNKVDDIYFSETLSFTTMCDPKISYIALYYADPNAGTYPDSWCVGGDGGYFPDEMDCSYSTSSKSYTAAGDGSPVGNLNYFPDINVGKSTQDHTLNAIKAYPNPFLNQVSIVYTLEQNQNVELSVFDLKGQIVTNLINAEQELGRYVINWDGSARNGQKLSAGTYIYQVKTTNWVKSAHITILK